MFLNIYDCRDRDFEFFKYQESPINSNFGNEVDEFQEKGNKPVEIMRKSSLCCCFSDKSSQKTVYVHPIHFPDRNFY